MDHTGGYITGPALAGLIGLPALEGKSWYSCSLTDLSTLTLSFINYDWPVCSCVPVYLCVQYVLVCLKKL